MGLLSSILSVHACHFITWKIQFILTPGEKTMNHPLHELTFVPPREEITVEDFERGAMREVVMHDGSMIVLKKLGTDYDPTDRSSAFCMLAEAEKK